MPGGHPGLSQLQESARARRDPHCCFRRRPIPFAECRARTSACSTRRCLCRPGPGARTDTSVHHDSRGGRRATSRALSLHPYTVPATVRPRCSATPGRLCAASVGSPCQRPYFRMARIRQSGPALLLVVQSGSGWRRRSISERAEALGRIVVTVALTESGGLPQEAEQSAAHASGTAFAVATRAATEMKHQLRCPPMDG